MEKYSKAVSEMYSQFKKFEAHPMEKYIGRLANYEGEQLEVVGYRKETDGTWELIVDGTKIRGWGWKRLNPQDVVFRNCERYFYVGIDDLIDLEVMEKYSQFKRAEANPMEKYIGRLAYFCGEKLEVVGYRNDTGNARLLIADGSKIKSWGWRLLDTWDVVFKKCEIYCYVTVNDLIYKKL